VPRQQLGSQVPLLRREVVVHRLVQLALAAFGLEPRAGPRVQLASTLGILLEQAAVEDVAQEVMAAKPRPLAVQRAQQQRGAGQPEKGAARRCVVAEHPRAEVGVEALEHRGLEDEATLVLGRGAQDLVGQRAEEVLATGGELLGDLADLVAEAQAQGRQVERRRPALGALLERCDIGRVEFESEPVTQEAQRLVVAEAQVVGAQVEHAALDA
jgi:hypothetical protein